MPALHDRLPSPAMTRFPARISRSAPLLAALVVLLATGSSSAQTPARGTPGAPARPSPSTVVVSTADYTETRVGGDQVVSFPGDELATDGPSIYGDVVRRPPGVVRHGLIRPRLNFVSELLKTVENL